MFKILKIKLRKRKIIKLKLNGLRHNFKKIVLKSIKDIKKLFMIKKELVNKVI